MKTLIILMLISCGKSENGFKRCYMREEAIDYCVSMRIATSGETTNAANLYCLPRYPVEGCYTLGGL